MNLETSWTLIRGAAAGSASSRDLFALRYMPAVRAYLQSRWRGRPISHELEDTAQEIFVHCFRDGGALVRVDADRPGGFRAFLYGIVRKMALTVEARRAREHERCADAQLEPEVLVAREASLSRVFDRAWALAVMKEAGELHRSRASEQGPRHERRVELLRLRFEEGKAIREIAEDWKMEPAKLHHEYADARSDFSAALFDVIAEHQGGSGESVERECDELLALLGEARD